MPMQSLHLVADASDMKMDQLETRGRSHFPHFETSSEESIAHARCLASVAGET